MRQIGLGQGEAVRSQQGEEVALETTQGDGGLAAEYLLKLAGARSVRPPCERGLHFRGVHPVVNVGLMAGAGELIEGKRGGQVNQRARYHRDRDCAVDRDISLVEAAHSPRDNACDPPVLYGRDLRRGRTALGEPEMERRGWPTQNRRLATRQDRGEVARLQARRAVSDSVHASPLRMEQPLVNPPLDGVAAEAGAEELPKRDDAVLAAGDLCRLTVR